MLFKKKISTVPGVKRKFDKDETEKTSKKAQWPREKGEREKH